MESNEEESVFLFLSTLTRRTSAGNYQLFVMAVLLFQERSLHEAKHDEKKSIRILRVFRNETWPVKSFEIKTTIHHRHSILLTSIFDVSAV
jgi:hypothetical protein